MEWIRSKECQEHVDNELKKQRKEFLNDLTDIWNNTTFFDDNDMTEFLKKQKKWET